MAKNKKNNTKQIILIALVVLLALALVFSRSRRLARRANIQVPDREIQQNNFEKDSIVEKETPEIKIMSDKNKLLGKVSTAGNDELVLVPVKYANREDIYMNKEAYDAFIKMYYDALSDDVSLKIMSGFRNFNHQKSIWEKKWNGEQMLQGNIRATDIADYEKRALEILKFSAMPGTSRHHWGTDIDLNSLNNSYFESGYGKKVYDWLLENAPKYGFCQPYTAKGDNRDRGYEEEKWHWSYLPVANQYYRGFEKVISYDDISGFDGAETAEKLKVIENFVLSINDSCIGK